MSGTHAHALYFHAHSPVHSARPESKLVLLLVFALSVVATPSDAFWAFAVHGLGLLAVLAISAVPITFFLARLAIDLPFVLFALFLPFFGGEPRFDWGPLAVSVPGLAGAWNILAKATLGAGASVLLAATTEVPDLLRGLGRLRVPRVLVAIAAFMIRYLEVVAGELRRTRIAMTARGYSPKWLGQVRPLAAASGALFIRSYERGERVHHAMLARGYHGDMPDLHYHHVPEYSLLQGLWPGVVPLAIMIASRLA
ncbi:MAG TPA: cobalt ECF transporter T component CbiQ [Acidimicrobiia bacterium]